MVCRACALLRVLIVSLCFGLSGVAAAQDLSATLNTILQKTNTTGAGIAIVRRGEPVQVISLGLADYAHKRPVATDTTFRTASAGKMFTALAVMRLVEDGKLSLDVPLRSIAPEVQFGNQWEAAAPVRVAHLLEHTTGWDDMHLAEFAFDNAQDSPLLERIAFHPDSRVSRWMPGTRMAYSNSGPAVAGYVVEKISGRRFEDFVEQAVFKPLGMNSATYFKDPLHGASGHDSNGFRRIPFLHILYRPAGSTSVTAADMAKLVQLFVNRGMVDGRQVFQPSTIARMEHAQTSDAARAGLPTGPGLGLLDRGYRGYRLLGHSGNIEGSHTVVWYEPNAGVGFVAMINSDTREALEQFSEAILGQLLPAQRPALPPALSAERWRGVDGLYVLANPRSHLTESGLLFGALRLQYTPGLLLRSRLLGTQVEDLALRGDFAMHPKSGIAYGVRASDPLAGEVVVFGTEVYRRVSPLAVGVAYACLFGWIIASVLAVLWGLAWVPNYLSGGIDNGPELAIRVRPLGCTLWMLVVAASVPLAGPSERTLGLVTPFSIWLMLASAVYGLAVLAGAVQTLRYRARPMRAGVRWFCSLHAGLHLCAALYLAWFGLLGFRTWA